MQNSQSISQCVVYTLLATSNFSELWSAMAYLPLKRSRWLVTMLSRDADVPPEVCGSCAAPPSDGASATGPAGPVIPPPFWEACRRSASRLWTRAALCVICCSRPANRSCICAMALSLALSCCCSACTSDASRLLRACYQPTEPQ